MESDVRPAGPRRPRAAGPGRARLAMFAGGDFAFNLYWQSSTLYLLFFYTEVAHVPVRTAAICYAVATWCDGAVNLAVGALLRRAGARRPAMRSLLLGGAVPLGAAFALVYTPPPAGGWVAVAWLLAGQILFRTLYALTNIPYLAMSARISADPRERTLVAGGRMIAGMLAAVVVATATLPLGERLVGRAGAPAFLAAAIAFAGVAGVVLAAVALGYREAVGEPAEPPPAGVAAASMWTVWRRPAFRWFALATVLMIVPITVLDRSVLYYFRYELNDEAAGRLTLGAMMAVSGVAVPLWTALSRAVGFGGVWVTAIGTCLVALVAFIALDPAGVLPVRAFLMAMQAGAIGLSFVMWAFLPEVIERGRREGDVDAEAVAYGWLAMLQRVAIGLGTLLLGMGFGRGGVRAGGAWLRLSLTAVPLTFLLLSGLVMLLNPYARLDRRRRRA